MKWMSTGAFAQLIEDHFPASGAKVREWCEDGTIPGRYAKRLSGQERKRWGISVRGIRYILEKILELEADEIAEVQAKAPVNFSQMVAA